eukprot:6181560-Pleurochrysis_carterae.AAC.3
MHHPNPITVACEESTLKPREEQPESQRGSKTSQRSTEVVKNGDGRGREKTEELDGGGVCATGPVATTVYARRAGRLLKRPRYRHLALAEALVLLLPVPTSDYVLRHVVIIAASPLEAMTQSAPR